MTCDKCKYFKIIQEPLRTKGELWDMGKAECVKIGLEVDFADHGKFKELGTCEHYTEGSMTTEEYTRIMQGRMIRIAESFNKWLEDTAKQEDIFKDTVQAIIKQFLM